MRRKIGDSLIRAGWISEQDLQVALAEHRRTGERLGAVLVRLELADERQIARTLALQLGLAYVNLADQPPDPAVLTLIPQELASRRVSVAVRFEQAALIVATADPLVFAIGREVESTLGAPVKPAVATRSDILRVIHSGYGAASPPPRPVSLSTPSQICRRCAGNLQPGWRFCPNCSTSTTIRPAWRPAATATDEILKPAVGGSV